MRALDRTVFRTLWREEWRLHAELFGGGRFATFPLVVLVLTAAAGVGLAVTGTDPATVEAGIRGLALLFGLYAGTAGFVGSASLGGLLDDVSLVLSTTETLPLSPSRVLGLFLLKDGLFYAVVFLLPVALGTVPLAVVAGGGAAGGWTGVGGAVTVGAAAAGGAAALWLETVALFALGTSVTVAAIALRTRETPRWVVVGLAGVAGVGGWAAGLAAPLFVAPDPSTVLAVAVAAVGVGGAAVAAYDPAYRPPSRAANARYARLAARVPGDHDGLVAKTLLDLARSGGGLWKPVVSAGLLLAVVAGLVRLVETIVGVRPAPGIFFGSVLALTAFTTYNWLTAFDSLEGYLILPISVRAVFAAKRRAFAVVGLPAGGLAYAVALAAVRTTAGDALLGAALFAGLSAYFFGLTVFLAGFDPNEFLFDPVRFAAFGAGVAVVLVPTLVASFLPAAGLAPWWAGVVGVAGAVAVGLAGIVLAVRAGPRWEAAVRAGEHSNS